MPDMSRRTRVFIRGVLLLIGTIIGAGIFALPAAFVRVGFWPATILFWFLAGVVLVTHLFFAEVYLIEGKRVRIAGAAGKELGPIGFWLATAVYPLQITGANLAYLILGGDFLAALARAVGLPFQFPILIWQLLFWAGGALIVLVGLRLVARVESVATWFLIGSLLLIAGILLFSGAPVSHIFVWTRDSWRQQLFPFGIFLFSLSGLSVIGEVVEVVQRRRKDVFRVVIVGSLGAALVSWIFATAVFIASGRGAEWTVLLPVAWAWLLPLAGFLAVATSFTPLAEDLKATYHIDFHFSERAAWVLALVVPFILLLLTRRDFLATIQVVGAVFSSIIGILVALISWLIFVRRRGLRRVSSFGRAFVVGVVIAVYLIGMIHWFLFV